MSRPTRTLGWMSVVACLAWTGCDGTAADPDASASADPDAGARADADPTSDTGAVDDAHGSADAVAESDAPVMPDPDGAVSPDPDASAPDASVPSDAGSPMPTPCGADGDCPVGARCITGLCFDETTVTDATPSIGSIARMVVGADLDGTLRLLTVDAADRTYDVVGRPGAFTVTPGGSASDMLRVVETGRAGTATAHSSFASGDERFVFADQTVTVREDRPIYYFDVAHAPDGTMHVLTTPMVPRRPSEFYDPYPLHLWTRSGGVWTDEELVRNVGIDKDLHLRHDARGAPEVLYTDTFWIKRWRLEAAGWASTILHTFAPVPSRFGGSLWIDDARGHSHLVHVLHTDAGDELSYVELDDDGVVRQAPIDGSGVTALLGSLSFDDAGDLFFLSSGDITSPNRRPYTLHRIGTDGVETRALLGTLRTDFSQSAAVAVAPDGTITVFVWAPAQPMEIRTLSPR